MSADAFLVVGEVAAVSRSDRHGVGKQSQAGIELLTGLGVAGDAHLGVTVQHLSRVRRDPGQPNLRQVHLIAEELYDELAGRGFALAAGQLGENVTTRGVDLLALPAGARLRLGATAVVEVTGLRNPCIQLNGLAPGLMAAVLERAADGTLIRKAGVMAVVRADGPVRPDDPIAAALPEQPIRRLRPV
jgi:MOSC domain-containing protein YiiM